jgi:hypothetical protein
MTFLTTLTKELFVQTIKTIKAGCERRDKLNEALSDVCNSWFICNIGEEWLEQLIVLLEHLLNDEPTKRGSVISWWLFEDVEKKSWWDEDGKTIERDLTTPEALYDYLVEEANQN